MKKCRIRWIACLLETAISKHEQWNVCENKEVHYKINFRAYLKIIGMEFVFGEMEIWLEHELNKVQEEWEFNYLQTL